MDAVGGKMAMFGAEQLAIADFAPVPLYHPELSGMVAPHAAEPMIGGAALELFRVTIPLEPIGEQTLGATEVTGQPQTELLGEVITSFVVPEAPSLNKHSETDKSIEAGAKQPGISANTDLAVEPDDDEPHDGEVNAEEVSSNMQRMSGGSGGSRAKDCWGCGKRLIRQHVCNDCVGGNTQKTISRPRGEDAEKAPATSDTRTPGEETEHRQVREVSAGTSIAKLVGVR